MSFLRFYEGAAPEKAKRKAEDSAEATKSRSKLYKEKRQRVFCVNWLKNRSWLKYDDEKKVMTCTLCIKYRRELTDNGSNLRGQGTFIQGSTNLKKSAVDDHETSKGHLKAVELENAAKRTSTDVLCVTKAGKALQKLREAERKRLNTLFRNAHALMKQNRPLSDFVWIFKLDIMKGLDIGNTYLNNKAALEFVKCIASAERQNTCRMLENVNYFTFIMDGTTDISGDEQEAVYVRFFKDGIICERYSGMGTPVSTCSADLFQFLVDLFRANEIDTGKLIGIASDGASDMVGKKSGLAALVRINVNDEILNLYCFAHRMELAFRDVFKKHKLYHKVMTMLIGMYYFYHKQYKNKKGLLRMIDAVKIKGVMPSKVTGTRWLPHLYRGIRNFLTTFRAFEAHLAYISHNNSKAEGIYKIMTSKDVLCFIFFLKEILDPLMRVSLKLQRPETSVAECSTWVASIVDLLEDYKSRDFKEVDELLTSGKCQGIYL